MALPVCAEAFIRAFFVVLNIAAKNWFWTIGIVIICYLLKSKPLLLGGLATFVDIIQDFFGLKFFIFATLEKVATGKISISSTFAVIMGIIWVMILLLSQANTLLKVFAIPVVFVMGIFMAFVPFFSIPSSIVFAFLLNDRKIANFTCLGMIIFVVLLSVFNLSFFCGEINEIVKLI